MSPFGGVIPDKILASLAQARKVERFESFLFRASVPSVDASVIGDHWRRFKLIVGCSEVYERLSITSLPLQMPIHLRYTKGLEVAGTLANLLIKLQAIDNSYRALQLSYDYLELATNGQLRGVEAYACDDAWCEWFLEDSDLPGVYATSLIGLNNEWWLLVAANNYC